MLLGAVQNMISHLGGCLKISKVRIGEKMNGGGQKKKNEIIF